MLYYYTRCVFLLGCVLDPFQIDLESVLLLNKLNALHQKKIVNCFLSHILQQLNKYISLFSQFFSYMNKDSFFQNCWWVETEIEGASHNNVL